MEVLLAIAIGILYAAGLYMVMSRSFVKVIFGIILLGNGVNILIFLLGRIIKGKPPIIPETASVITDAFSDPVPQALILTAIVISFGLQSFAIVLVKRMHKDFGTDDINELNTTDHTE